MSSDKDIATRGAGDLKERIVSFLTQHTTLSLATSGSGGAPAAAAVFYAHDASLRLYFLSEERTQHGMNLARNPAVAGTIHADGQDWREIRGLQVRGVVAPVPSADLATAALHYVRKYAFVAALLAGDGGAIALAGPLARARFYCLRPRWYRLIDNGVRFGFKEELALPESEDPGMEHDEPT